MLINNNKCSKHSDEEIAINGTCISLEIFKAVQKGYKILKYYEVWHWDNKEQYDPQTKSGGLFTDYINQALKEKLEADGYPSALQKNKKINIFMIIMIMKV